MGEKTGLLRGFLTVNRGLKPIRGGKDTYFRIKYMSEKSVFRWIDYSWKLVLHCATIILFHYFSACIFFDPPLMECLLHYIIITNSFQSPLVYHPTLYLSICPTEQLFWFSVGGSSWKHYSEVFSTLMRPRKLL